MGEGGGKRWWWEVVGSLLQSNPKAFTEQSQRNFQLYYHPSDSISCRTDWSHAFAKQQNKNDPIIMFAKSPKLDCSSVFTKAQTYAHCCMFVIDRTWELSVIVWASAQKMLSAPPLSTSVSVTQVTSRLVPSAKKVDSTSISVLLAQS